MSVPLFVSVATPSTPPVVPVPIWSVPPAFRVIVPELPLECGGASGADVEVYPKIRAGADRRGAAVEGRVGPEIGRRNSREKQGGEHRAGCPGESGKALGNLTEEKPFSQG